MLCMSQSGVVGAGSSGGGGGKGGAAAKGVGGAAAVTASGFSSLDMKVVHAFMRARV